MRPNSATLPRHSGLLDIKLASLDEDPQQPRSVDNPGFAANSLNELAASIRLRGVKTPISVREHPSMPGRYIINHGARRYRSSLIAGKLTIPAFIDNDYNLADQVIENLQRNALTAREVANFIGRELAKGLRKGEIAHAISKSAAFVTQHANLLDLPDVIADAFNCGRVKDVTVVNELLFVHKRHPNEVRSWMNDMSQEITRGSVRLLREYLAKARRLDEDGADEAVPADEDATAPTEDDAEEQYEEPRIAARQYGRSLALPRIRTPVIVVSHASRDARLLLHLQPTTEGSAWLRYVESGEDAEVKLADLRLVALLSS